MSTPEPELAHWRKSTHSNSSGAECVELAGLPAAVAVRDSKDPEGPKLVLERTTFSAFARGLRDG